MVKPTNTATSYGPISGRSLQPQEEAVLAGFASSKESERLARLEADRDLLLQLGLNNYEGPVWVKFATALAEYGVQVIKAWALTGQIFHECGRKGLGFVVAQPIRNKDDALGLAGETVAGSLITYREKVLIPGRWDPTRGASLRTFFIGQCVYQFPNVYRRWIRENAPTKLEAAEMIDPPTSSPRIPDMIHLRRKWDALPPDDVRRLQLMVEMGYTAGEIAEITGASKRSVDSRLSRHHSLQKTKP